MTFHALSKLNSMRFKFFFLILPSSRPQHYQQYHEFELHLLPPNGTCVPGAHSNTKVKAEVQFLVEPTSIAEFVVFHESRDTQLCFTADDLQTKAMPPLCVAFANHGDFVELPPPRDTSLKFRRISAFIQDQDQDPQTQTISAASTLLLANNKAHCEPENLDEACSKMDVPGAETFPAQRFSPSLSAAQLRIKFPTINSIVSSNLVVLETHVSLKNGTRINLEGEELCIGYNHGHDNNFGCIVASGPFTELTIEAAENIETRVTLQVELVSGPFANLTALTSFILAPAPPISNNVLSAEYLEVESNLNAFKEEKLVLMLNHWTEDLRWVKHQPFKAVVYDKHPTSEQRGSKHFVEKNVAGEASSYLKFIVDYYDALPDSVLFLHSHRYAYHQTDLLILLGTIDRGKDFSDAYCNVNDAAWGLLDENVAYLKEHWGREGWLRKWLGEQTDEWPLDRCCAQFVVGRDRIRRRPKEFYVEALEVVTRCDVEDREKSRRLGLLMEWIWHVVFGENIVTSDVEFLVPTLKEFEQVDLGGGGGVQCIL